MDIDTLANARYVSLTTFKKDGTPVATPVWLARDGDTLVVLTGPTAGKTKRLRNHGRVRVAPCDMRGRVKGEAIQGTAEVQSPAGTEATLALIRKRYGIQARIAFWRGDRRATTDPTRGRVGIAISLVRSPLEVQLPWRETLTDVRTVLWDYKRFDLFGQVMALLAGAYGILIFFRSEKNDR